jgi:hypothetical protein
MWYHNQSWTRRYFFGVLFKGSVSVKMKGRLNRPSGGLFLRTSAAATVSDLRPGKIVSLCPWMEGLVKAYEDFQPHHGHMRYNAP